MKNCRLKEIQVQKSDPYSEDLLNSHVLGVKLHRLVDSFSDGFVMAINGKWGSGKTTFVKMWQQQMINECYETIYYNSWENDFLSDPLIGIIAEFKKKSQTGGEQRIEKFTNTVRKISLSMVPSLLALMAKYFTGLNAEDLEKVIKDGSKEAIDLLNKTVDNYIEQQQSIKEFRRALADYITDITPDKPLIFIIDELDRCKPDFAVRTLERIKHLFSVKNVVFILAIDHEQLCHSVRGYYGSDKIAADDYLRRFIDYQLDYTSGNTEILLQVFERFEFSNTVLNENNEIDHRYDYFKQFVLLIFTIRKLSIRDLEKWMLQTRLIINHSELLKITPETLAFLKFLRIFDTDFYNHYIVSEISDEAILEYLAQNFSAALFDTGSYSANFTYETIAELIGLKYHFKDLVNANIFDNEGNFLFNIPTPINEKWLRDKLQSRRSFPMLKNVVQCLSDIVLD